MGDPALNWVMWMLQTGVMGPKSGRSLGLSHFDAKRPYASQRKMLTNYAPDRAYIRHWQAAINSSRQRVLSNRGGAPASRQSQHDKHEGLKVKAKDQAPMEQFC